MARPPTVSVLSPPTARAMLVAGVVALALMVNLRFILDAQLDYWRHIDPLVWVVEGGCIALAVLGLMLFGVCGRASWSSKSRRIAAHVAALLFWLLGLALCLLTLGDVLELPFRLFDSSPTAHERLMRAILIVCIYVVAAGGSLWAAVLGHIIARRLGPRSA